MKQIAAAILLGILVVGGLGFLTGQIPSILPMSPITQSVIFQKNITVLGAGGNVARRTTAALNYTIGIGGDYATIEAAVATLPDFIEHAVTLTVKNGTTITTNPYLSNLKGSGSLTIRADGSDGHSYVATAGSTYISSVFFGGYQDDRWNDCFLLIVDGTGKDNGFVQITDTVQETQRAYVTSWPGTQPDPTSQFIIVGALFAVYEQANLSITNCLLSIWVQEVGFVSLTGTCYYGINAQGSENVGATACGFYRITSAGFYVFNATSTSVWTCAFVGCNTYENTDEGAVIINRSTSVEVGGMCYFTDNYNSGVYLVGKCFAEVAGNYGAGNGTWGVYAKSGARVNFDLETDFLTGSSGPICCDDVSEIWQVSNSLVDNAIFETGIVAFFGELTVKDTTIGVSAIYRVDGGAVPVLISGHTNFSTTKDTDNKINVYFDTTYKIQNCNTAASVVKSAFSGMK